ncbi:hypothetical protein AMATHDRAFT_5032 [Amanita thiersii Skay4041]|uniref:Uncharacterized protein n=1 Tax=Amanita thiersii Skay4041 TaxID=703135 RepID=A0A2A9NE30_9AGAR|nr:hypothetical protein AMATHDRAFT_5032 [Amanita thiersii Skay4041]
MDQGSHDAMSIGIGELKRLRRHLWGSALWGIIHVPYHSWRLPSVLWDCVSMSLLRVSGIGYYWAGKAYLRVNDCVVTTVSRCDLKYDLACTT